MRRKPLSFTAVCVVVAALGVRSGAGSVLSKVGLCLSIFMNVTFHGAYLVDQTAFARMRAKNGWSPLVFHAGNALFHWAPLAYYVAHDVAGPVEYEHAAMATVLYLAWAAYARDRGTAFRFEDTYVPMPAGAYERCGALGVCAMAGAAWWW